MPFPLPTPEDLTRQQEALMELSLRRHAEAKGLDVSGDAIARAVRSPTGLVAALVRAQAQLLYGVHLHIRYWGDQYMPDTAEAENLIRHALVWGITRRPATFAVGRAAFVGAPGTAIPQGLELRAPSGVLYATTTAAAIPAGGSVIVDIRASTPGALGNAAGGTRLTLVSPLLGLTQQQAVIDASGLAGGAAEEADGELLDRVLERIRQPAHGGAAFDYPTWVKNAFAVSHVRTLPGWVGRGSVGVCVAMGTRAAPRVPTPAELDAMLDYLGRIGAQAQGVRPVTAEVVMVAAELVPVPIRMILTPDDATTRGAVTSGVAAFFAREAGIGDLIPRSRLSEAISSARGEYAHELIAPVANITPTPTQLPVPPAAILWGAP